MKRFTLITIVSFMVVFSNLSITYGQGATARDLHQAIIDGDLDKVKSLLSKGIDINAKNTLGGTPLHNAISHKNEAIAEFILSKGPDLNARDNQGQTPLFLAIQTKQKKIVGLLLARNVDVNVVARGGQNALTLARSMGDTELVDQLVKRGATEPALGLEDDMYPGMRRGAPGAARPAGPVQPVARPTTEPSVLSDPNEIKARVKMFSGLEKAIKDVNSLSDSEERQWCQLRYDNRSLLNRAVLTQFEKEMELVLKTAKSEKANKTVAAIDTLISQKRERTRKVGRELLQLRREGDQTQSVRGRGRGRMSSSRSSRGRSSTQGAQNNMADSLYGDGDMRGARSTRPTRPTEQSDPQTEEEIRLWSQADYEKKKNLAEKVHQQLLAEMETIRVVAVEEKAKKTTAAIDGVMLARQERYNKCIPKIEEAELKLQERLERQKQLESRGRGRGNSGYQQSSSQQNTQQRGRTRRR